MVPRRETTCYEELLDGNLSRLPQPLSFEILFGCLAEYYESKAGDEACLELFLDLDSVAVATGSRNLLQERLLAAYAGCCGIDLEEKK